MRMRMIQKIALKLLKIEYVVPYGIYIYKHIGTRKFLTKALWVYSHLKSGFLYLQKVT